MAKLTRVTQPIFASAAAANETSVFGTMKTSAQYTSNIADSIDTVAFTKGWNDAVELGYAPFIEDMNTVQRAITYQIAYNQQEGIPEWASDTTYFKDSWVKYNGTNGAQIYESLVDNNIGNLVSDNTKWKLVFDTANGYVTTNTAQTITGIKTFNSSQTLNGNTLKCFDFTRGTNPADTRNLNLYMTDSTALSGDNTAFGLFRTSVNPTGGVTSLIRAFKNNTAGTNDYAEIYVHYPITGNPYTHAPTPTDTTTTSGTQIATTGWVNSAGNNAVHKTGDETISGTKTFNDITTLKHILQLQSTEIAKGTTPSSTKYQILAFYDKNGTVQGNKTGQIYTTYTQSGMLSISMDVFQPVSGSRNGASISVKYPASGNPYTEAPASDVNNSIVTTVNKSKGDNGYFQLGNGLIIQWGKSTTTNSEAKITLPKAFTTTNYAVVGNSTQALGNTSNRYLTGWAQVIARTTTNFTMYMSNYENSHWWNDVKKPFTWIAIGY